MPVILYREQRKQFIAGVEQTGLWQAGQKVWSKPVAATWNFLNPIGGQSVYTITERTATTLTFNRNAPVRSHLMFNWNLPVGTRVRFTFGGAGGAAALWCRLSPDASGTSVAQAVLNQAYNTAEIDFTVNTLQPYFGFLTSGSEPSSFTFYTMSNLIINLP